MADGTGGMEAKGTLTKKSQGPKLSPWPAGQIQVSSEKKQNKEKPAKLVLLLFFPSSFAKHLRQWEGIGRYNSHSLTFIHVLLNFKAFF